MMHFMVNNQSILSTKNMIDSCLDKIKKAKERYIYIYINMCACIYINIFTGIYL